MKVVVTLLLYHGSRVILIWFLLPFLLVKHPREQIPVTDSAPHAGYERIRGNNRRRTVHHRSVQAGLPTVIRKRKENADAPALSAFMVS